MRLYIKLILMIVITASIQRYLDKAGGLSELWFGVRCDVAYTINSERMIDQLVEEASRHRYCIYYTNATAPS